jgi:CBS domain-containing protein
VLPVVDETGRLVGLVSHHALREAILSRASLGEIVLAADLADVVESLSPRDTLRRALAVMNSRGLDALPVVEPEHGADASPRFVGLLSRGDLLVAYERVIGRAV